MQAKTDVKPRLLTDEQAATYLGISSRSVKRLRAEGLLKFVKIRGSIRYDVEDLDKLIERLKSRDSEIVDNLVEAIEERQSYDGKP